MPLTPLRTPVATNSFADTSALEKELQKRIILLLGPCPQFN